MSELIWFDHLEDLTRAVSLYKEFLRELNSPPKNGSDLTFKVPEVIVEVGSSPTGWSIAHDGGIVYLKLGGDEDA